MTHLCWNMGYTHIGPLSLILKLIKISQPFYQLWQLESEAVWWPAWQPFIKLPIRPRSLTLFSWDSSLAAPALTGRALRDNSWQEARNLTNASYEFKVKGMYSTETGACRNKVAQTATVCTCRFNVTASSSQPTTCVKHHPGKPQNQLQIKSQHLHFNASSPFFVYSERQWFHPRKQKLQQIHTSDDYSIWDSVN